MDDWTLSDKLENGWRPKLPTDPFKCPESLRKLTEDCWSQTPSLRPSFAKIDELLSEVLIDCAIFDDSMRKWWKENFTVKHQVQISVSKNVFSEKFVK